MGNLTNNSFTISVTRPEYNHFNFHKDYNKAVTPQQITFPSFISNNDAHQVSYCTRSAFNSRQYELSYEQNNQNAVLNFTKLKEDGLDLWKNIGSNEIMLLQQGYVIRLGSTEFEIKKVCRSFADLQEWEENLQTISDADPREKSFQMMSSRKLQGSKYTNGLMFQSRNIMAAQSMQSSFGLDQQGQFCRYCYGRDSTSANPLLNLCICSGSVKFCHYYCMKNWISSRSKTKASDCYEYFEYDMSCQVCKQQINRTVTHKGKKYTLYSESLVHPPFIVLSYRNQSSSTKVQEYIINFDYTPTVRIGRSANSDIKLKEQGISAQHCEIIFENGQFLLKNLNPVYGTLVRIDKEWNFSPVDNQLEFLIGDHLVRLKEKSQSCFWSQPLKLQIKNCQK